MHAGPAEDPELGTDPSDIVAALNDPVFATDCGGERCR